MKSSSRSCQQNTCCLKLFQSISSIVNATFSVAWFNAIKVVHTTRTVNNRGIDAVQKGEAGYSWFGHVFWFLLSQTILSRIQRTCRLNFSLSGYVHRQQTHAASALTGVMTFAFTIRTAVTAMPAPCCLFVIKKGRSPEGISQNVGKKQHYTVKIALT